MRSFAFYLPLTAFVAAAPALATPQAALDSLVAEERRLSEAASHLTPAEGIASMLAEDAVIIARSGFVRGRAAALESLRGNPSTIGRHARWRSIRAGVSADGRHGFTLGHLDIEGGAPERAHRRYLAYWVRGPQGWRVAALKQVLRLAGETDAPVQPAALPVRAVPGAVEHHRRSLIAAEQAFSDRAQSVGIRQSFQEFGRPDAIHISATEGFAIGLAAIGREQAGEPPGPSPVRWSADHAIVAASGDLGITIGHIRPNGPVPKGQPASLPFFTIWRRDGPGQPWRYIAE